MIGSIALYRELYDSFGGVTKSADLTRVMKDSDRDQIRAAGLNRAVRSVRCNRARLK